MAEEPLSLLERIHSPEDLKKIPAKDLDKLAEEIRTFLVGRVSENGGHLASNLGVVELTIALHRVFSTPKDHIIFDVGHQSYVHKLLTGRREEFDTLRCAGGLSGFPKREESEHDAFGTGHASTSLSAALGFAEADKLSGSDAYTVCVLGDGAYTGGMIHEALNNCKKRLRLIIILNENEMSINKNLGRFAKSLSHLRATHGYIRTKNFFRRAIRVIPGIGKWIFNRMLRFKIGIKAALYGSNTFEDLGLFYLGPADGHNEQLVERLLREAKDCGQSCIIHLKTKKGKGYAPAEATPDLFHGVSPSCTEKGCEKTFSAAMGEYLTQMAEKDPKICAITAAMASGTGLLPFRKAYQQRFFDVGIAEEHAVTFAAGLSAEGYKPAVAIYSTFLQRAYDNIIHDVALQKLPMVFFVDRAGLNPSDGPTHAGVFDVAFLSQIPNLHLYTPATLDGLKKSMEDAFSNGKICAIRYPNGREDAAVKEHFYPDGVPFEIGMRQDYTGEEAPDAVLVVHGRMASEALQVQKCLAEQNIRLGLLLLEKITPIGEIAAQIASRLPDRTRGLFFLEEEIEQGGMGMSLSAALKEYPTAENKKVGVFALRNPFLVPGRNQTIREAAGLDAAHIAEKINMAIGTDGKAT